MGLIDRQAAIDAIYASTADGDRAEWFAYVVRQVPSAEKRGKWLVDGLDHRGGVDWMHCSACGSRMVNVPADHTPFCPNCGAKMEE